MTDEELKTWALAHTEGPMRSPLAAGILRLLHEKSASVVKLQLTELGNTYLCRLIEGRPAPGDESKMISFGYPPGTVFPALPPQPVVEPICGVCFESSGPPAPEDESHLDAPTSLSAPSLLRLADDGCPHAGEPD